MRLRHLPPGIEVPVYEAICALTSYKGLEAVHLQTIRYCIALCPDVLERTYIAYFDGLGNQDSKLASCVDGKRNLGRRGGSTVLGAEAAIDLLFNDKKHQTAAMI